ncbi:MAG: carbohydrate binding domain-containing protein [Thermoguttaceae bacterium]
MRLLETASAFLLTCSIGWAADLAPFAPPWDDATPGPTNISGTLDKPAGKSGFVHVKDGHLYTGDHRLRLFGANLTAAADFPDHETADKVAARMAKFGLNAVRFHFLDATWGMPRLIDYESGDSRNWNADAIDRLDYFFARLKEHGIYADLNLLVGRRFGVGDGVDPKVNQLDWKAAHAVGFFHAPHMEAQKRYARQLLTHLNPYTKLTYAEDPAVALVEINNENGLIHTWMGGDFDALPDLFAQDLRQQWNQWLGQRYADTAALSNAWGARDEPLAAEMLANAKLTRGLEGWNVEQHQGAAVDSTAEGGTAILRVRKPGTADWHVQFNQTKLAIRKGAVYTVSFRAAADRQRKVTLNLQQAHDPWGNLGLGTSLKLTKKPQPFTFTFIATDDDENARLNFSDMNQQGAEFRFGEISLKPGGRVGLGEGESVEKRNIRLPKFAESRSLPAGGRRDWVRFLWETERKHWTGMQRFLKEAIGVKAPIVGTIVATSTPNLMADLDVVDTHAYWEHPQFPGKPWDMDNWLVKNISMVDYPDRATVTRLAFQRVAGKPHLVTEYNHPAPNAHAGEGPIFIAAFGALQDWDGIFLYTYSHEEKETKAGCIPGFFSIGPHPTIMANVPAASLLFRRGDLSPAKQVLHVPLPPEKEMELIAEKGHAWGVLAVEEFGVDLKNAMLHRIALDISGKFPAPDAEPVAKDLQTSDTGELSWRLPGKDQGVLELRGSKTKAVIGHVDNQRLDLGHGVRVIVGRTRAHWCTLALTLLEGESFDHNPRRALLVATGITENTDMGWKDEARSTVGQNWGKPPSLVEPIAATIQIPRGAAIPVLYPLDDRGQRGEGIPTTAAGDGAARFKIGPPHGAIWYEIDYAGK